MYLVVKWTKKNVNIECSYIGYSHDPEWKCVLVIVRIALSKYILSISF